MRYSQRPEWACSQRYRPPPLQVTHPCRKDTVRQLRAERHARGVSCWQQFVSMLFCQLGRAHSLREIEQGLRSCEGKLSHLGIEVLARSSLSYVNEHRPWQLYRNVFHGLYGRFQSQLALAGGRGRKKGSSAESVGEFWLG